MGTILQTSDGGRTWRQVQGQDRRLALLTIAARPSRISFPLLAKFGGELGYRSGVLLPARRDIGPDGHARHDLDLRLQDAVSAAGGCIGEIDWRFPITLPGLEHDSSRLIADWDRRTEGRLREVFLGKLVSRIRTWRPEVIVIDQAAADDATAVLLNDAVVRAVQAAADPTRFIEQADLTALQPWRVRKVYRRLADGSTGQATIDLYEHLPRLRATVCDVSTRAAARLLPSGKLPPGDVREHFELVLFKGQPPQPHVAAGDLFAGIALAPGTGPRRFVSPLDEAQANALKTLAQRRRNFHGYARHYLDEPRHAGQIIAQLDEITAGMTSEQAALELVTLADEYRRRQDWDLVEMTLIELVQRYPSDPAAADAMRWLLQLWTGAEPAWQRLRRTRVAQQRFDVDGPATLARLHRLLEAAGDPSSSESLEHELGPDPVTLAASEGTLKIGAISDWRTGTVQHWHDQALRMASLIRRTAPALFRTPEVQFPLASLLRQRGSDRLADHYYRRFHGLPAGNVWKQAAQGELWLTTRTALPPKPVAKCVRTPQRPTLDGLLSDPCWQTAEEIRLGRDGEEPARDYAFVMLAYDAEYLYLAASVPRDPNAPTDGPEHAGRT
ncbi:MAG: hypothetical protein ACREIV_05150, partial [Planctomycetaceae bacterium]